MSTILREQLSYNPSPVLCVWSCLTSSLQFQMQTWTVGSHTWLLQYSDVQRHYAVSSWARNIVEVGRIVNLSCGLKIVCTLGVQLYPPKDWEQGAVEWDQSISRHSEKPECPVPEHFCLSVYLVNQAGHL